MNKEEQKTGFAHLLGGTMLVAGTAIGAGMLGLPMISAGMWFYWSTALLVISWFMMLRSSQALLEVNLHFQPGDSFHTLTRQLLSPFWTTLNGLSVAFVLYTLVYAYVSGGGSVVQQALLPIMTFPPPRFFTSLLFALLLAACIWWSSKAVDRMASVFMGGMVITFIISLSGMLGHLQPIVLFDRGGGGGKYIFIWCAVSTYLTSFCFHASVPSLIKYLGKNGKMINRCLIGGTFLAFACYFLWILAADGIIPRVQYKIIISEGANVGNLLEAADGSLGMGLIMRCLELFSLLAVATSFLGAGLGLFDYMADLCNFDDSRMGRTKTMLVTLLPPMICGLIWPDGFLPAIGWAGLAAAIWSVIVPALMLRAGRRNFAPGLYTAPGGRLLIPLLVLYGILVGVCHILFVFDLLPMYQ